jgi:multiple sugar transport system permease protein
MTAIDRPRPASAGGTPKAEREQVTRRTPATWLRGGGLSNLVFLLPMLIIFGIFSWWPIVRSVVMSFQHTNLVTAPTFVGWDNFVQVVNDPLFWTAVGNTGWL